MIKHKSDSIKELHQKEAEAAEKAETIELLKGCIMELADVVYGEEETV